MKYRAEIDGLRALAIVPVVLFHAGFEWFSGGFIGVDVFFVISGYLITTILIRELGTGCFSLGHFYERRIRRILPALFLVAGCTIPFAWMWMLPDDMQDFAQSLAAVAVFSSNFLFWSESGYFDMAAELKPLLHTWSLAVEEQYYIFFPLLLAGCWKIGTRRLLWWLAGAFLASLALAGWMVHAEPEAAFYLLPTRAWEILLGALCAFYPVKEAGGTQRVRQMASLLGLLLLAWAIFAFDRTTPTPGLQTLIPTLGAACIILFARRGTFACWLLGARPMVAIGLISYSFYLWHQPVFALARYRMVTDPSAEIMAGLIVLSAFAAAVSWKYIEQPFRQRHFSRKQLFMLAAAGSLLMIAFGLAGHFTKGFPGRQVSHPLAAIVANYQPQNNVLQKESWQWLHELSGAPDYAVQNNVYDNILWFDVKDDRKKLLIVGNSHSKDLWNILTHSTQAKAHFQHARYGIPLRRMFVDERFFNSPNYRASDIVMLATRFDDGGEDLHMLQAVVKRLQRDGKTVVLVKNIFEFPSFRNGSMTLADTVYLEAQGQGITSLHDIADRSNARYFTAYESGITRAHVHEVNRQIDVLASENPNLIVLNRMDYVCNTAKRICYSMDEKLNKFFYDYGHHTLAGAAHFGAIVDEVDWLAPVIAAGAAQHPQ